MAALSDLKMVSRSALCYFWNSILNLCKFEISHHLTRHFGTLNVQGDRAHSWHILETLQGSCLKVCKVLGESTQIFEKLELVTKIMFGYHGNNESADFYQHFSENDQLYLEHAKIVHFSFVLSIYTECGNKVAWSKDVLRYHLLGKYSVSKKNEIS